MIKSNSQGILDHLNNYYEKVTGGREFNLSELQITFSDMAPILNTNGLDYAAKRLPVEIENNPKIYLLNSQDQLDDIDARKNSWKSVKSAARRRFAFYNTIENYLAFCLSSDSDIDDIINNLLATKKDLKIQFLIDHNFDYFKNASGYVDDLLAKTGILDIDDKPVYFISSNLHSLVNLTGGFLYHYQNEIFNYVQNYLPDLAKIWEKIKTSNNVLRVNDFLYYISSKYFAANPEKLNEKKAYEYDLGFIQIKPDRYIDCGIQILPIKSIFLSKFIDPYLKVNTPETIKSSEAVIVNIEYPLGFTAYFILRELLNRLKNLKGVYIMGKAAILSGEVGDIQIPSVVFDERTGNTFNTNNIFNNSFPKTALQSKILINQKAVSVYGTFLENIEQLTKYNADGFNIIEMESGPYLNALIEKYKDLNSLPFDFGIANYASDNPLSQTLGEGAMNLKGIEPTYLASLAIIQRIIDLESSAH